MVKIKLTMQCADQQDHWRRFSQVRFELDSPAEGIDSSTEEGTAGSSKRLG